ncbi:MAG: NAD-dependent deacylase [Desulfuromonadales bacterium]|nr:NAD-dependent deacylase [Desulfuromonadales bacterium]
MDSITREKITKVAQMVTRAKKLAVFTGAGVSTESGIPDFRSAGGIWSRFDPDDFTIQRFLTSPQSRRKQWELLLGDGFFGDCRPNPAHEAIAELERMNRLSCVITQNIDGLHQKAGNSPGKVFELHGNMKSLRCLTCQVVYPLDLVRPRYSAGGEPPACEKCGGILKPEVIFFGEALPERILEGAIQHARSCDLFLVIGSSLVVYPAAYLPLYAKESGACLVIINRDDTPYDHLADLVINGGAGEVMSGIIGEVG